MPNCNCSKYDDLEMLRKVISKRIRESKELKKRLTPLVESYDKEHQLWTCNECGENWQSSLAWNWGNEFYLFKVPQISKKDWLENPYVQADELLTYVASMSKFLSQEFEQGSDICKKADCNENAVKGLTMCLKHHVENLQKSNMIQEQPIGRWFDPYIEENFIPNL